MRGCVWYVSGVGGGLSENVDHMKCINSNHVCGMYLLNLAYGTY